MEKHYTLSAMWGLQDLTLVRGNSTWPTEDDLRANLGLRNFDLSTVRVKEIKYYKVGSILSM